MGPYFSDPPTQEEMQAFAEMIAGASVNLEKQTVFDAMEGRHVAFSETMKLFFSQLRNFPGVSVQLHVWG